jgi:hypothetical protein
MRAENPPSATLRVGMLGRPRGRRKARESHREWARIIRKAMGEGSRMGK